MRFYQFRERKKDPLTVDCFASERCNTDCMIGQYAMIGNRLRHLPTSGTSPSDSTTLSILSDCASSGGRGSWRLGSYRSCCGRSCCDRRLRRSRALFTLRTIKPLSNWLSDWNLPILHQNRIAGVPELYTSSCKKMHISTYEAG